MTYRFYLVKFIIVDIMIFHLIFIEENEFHLEEVSLDLSILIGQLQRLIVLNILKDCHVYQLIINLTTAVFRLA
jgi:hypothetical protein